MKVTRLQYERFRNLKDGVFEPCEGVNVIMGENAQGKTNLLESIWLFTGAKSFRQSKDREMVAFQQEDSHLQLDFFAGGRDQQATISIKGRRTAQLNGIAQSSAAKLAGIFCGVVFSPAHLSLIKGGPQERRHLMDAAYCQLRPTYVQTLSDYARVLVHRNALCKAQNSGDGMEEMFDLWDKQLAQLGCLLIHSRQVYLRRMTPEARRIYRGLSGEKEDFDLQYLSTVPNVQDKTPAEIAQILYEQLKLHRADDLAAGFTTVGPHRDDLEVTIDGRSARHFGSQGQQRSAVLAIKLAEASLLEKMTGEKPIALLDDVMSELDLSRQDYILNHIQDWQVFITCCDSTSILKLVNGREFRMKDGILSTK